MWNWKNVHMYFLNNLWWIIHFSSNRGCDLCEKNCGIFMKKNPYSVEAQISPYLSKCNLLMQVLFCNHVSFFLPLVWSKLRRRIVNDFFQASEALMVCFWWMGGGSWWNLLKFHTSMEDPEALQKINFLHTFHPHYLITNIRNTTLYFVEKA